MVILAVVWSNLIKPFVIKLCKISNKELFLNTVLCDNFGRSMIKSNQALIGFDHAPTKIITACKE